MSGLTIRHYFRGLHQDIRTAAEWDALRATKGPFGLPSTRQTWETLITDALRHRAEAIASLASGRHIASYGVGTAGLELALSHVHDGPLTVGDFSPATIGRLRVLFPEATVVLHDLLHDEPLKADLHLMYRLDSEFTGDEWRRILARYGDVVFIPIEYFDLRAAARELRARLTPSSGWAGYIRTERAVIELWRASHLHHRTQIHDLPGFLLRRREVT